MLDFCTGRHNLANFFRSAGFNFSGMRSRARALKRPLVDNQWAPMINELRADWPARLEIDKTRERDHFEPLRRLRFRAGRQSGAAVGAFLSCPIEVYLTAHQQVRGASTGLRNGHQNGDRWPGRSATATGSSAEHAKRQTAPAQLVAAAAALLSVVRPLVISRTARLNGPHSANEHGRRD